MAERPFATLHRLADRLGVPPKFVRDEAEAGRLPCIHRGEQLLFHVDTIERLLLEEANRGDVLVSPRRAARLLGIPESFLRREAVHGRIPHLKDGARILMNPQAVRAALQKRDGANTDGGNP